MTDEAFIRAEAEKKLGLVLVRTIDQYLDNQKLYANKSSELTFITTRIAASLEVSDYSLNQASCAYKIDTHPEVIATQDELRKISGVLHSLYKSLVLAGYISLESK